MGIEPGESRRVLGRFGWEQPVEHPFAHSHSSGTERKFVVNDTTRPIEGSLKRSRTVL